MFYEFMMENFPTHSSQFSFTFNKIGIFFPLMTLYLQIHWRRIYFVYFANFILQYAYDRIVAYFYTCSAGGKSGRQCNNDLGWQSTYLQKTSKKSSN